MSLATNAPQDELRGDFRRYLELGLQPLWDKLELKADESTEKLYNAIIEANMLSVNRYVSSQQFYDRFVTELKKQPDAGGHVPYYSTPSVLEAARKAAGVEE